MFTFYNGQGRAVAYIDDDGESIYLYDLRCLQNRFSGPAAPAAGRSR